MELDVRHIAKLARLQLQGNEIKTIAKEMSEIVKMVENLPELPSAGALLDPDDTMQLREDAVTLSYPREDILKNAPHAAEGCFVVPQTVE